MKKLIFIFFFLFFIRSSSFSATFQQKYETAPKKEKIRLNVAINAQVCQTTNNQLQNCTKKIILPKEETVIHLSFCSESEVFQSCTGFWTNTFYDHGHQIETRLSISENLLGNRWSYEFSVKQQDSRQARETRQNTYISLEESFEIPQPLSILGKPISIDEVGTVIIPELIIKKSESSFSFED